MPTLLGLCFNTLEHVVAELVQQEAIGELIMGHVVIILLLYRDDVLVFANTLGDAKKLKKELEEFCMHAKLSVNSCKTKTMLVKS